MRLEDALTEMGNDPISRLENFRAVIAYINGQLVKAGSALVDMSTASDKVLEIVYSVSDQDVQTKILDRSVKDVGKDNRFKNILVGAAIVITVVIVVGVTYSVMSGVPLTPEAIEIWKTIGTRAFDIVELLVKAVVN